MAANLYHCAVHYNCSKKQQKRIPAAVQSSSRFASQRSALQLNGQKHKRIPATVQFGSRYISQRCALQLLKQATQTYSCRRPDQQQIYITAQCIKIAVTSNRNVFLPPSRPEADLHHSTVYYNCSNKQLNLIRAAVQTGSSTISQRSALKLQ